MCSPAGETPCTRGDAASGFCYCVGYWDTLLFSSLLYAVAFKILYYPVWLLLKQDLDSVCCDCKAVARLSVLIVFFLYGFLVLIAAGLLASYTGSATGVGRETLS